MNIKTTDKKFMARALELAVRGIGTTSPNPRVGAVIVKAGKIIAEGWHKKAGSDHAEIVALKKIGRNAAGATMYITLEPCSTQGRTPPCTEAIIDSGMKRVVVAMTDPNPSHRGRGMPLSPYAGECVINFRQRGQILLLESQVSIQSTSKKCPHGNTLTLLWTE